jgi:hypothetical protein
MKKSLMMIALMMSFVTLSLVSCEKEDITTRSCNCGVIANDGINSQTNCYWLEIRNDCSGNKKKFCFDQDIWMNNYVGDRFCVTNQEW